MKDMIKVRSKILKGRKLQIETKALRNSYAENPSSSLKEDIVNNTKKLQKII